MSLNIVYTEDSIKEINELLNNPKYYLNTTGAIAYSADDDVINLVLAHMTDKPSNVDISKETRIENVRDYIDKGYSLSTEEFGETWNYIAEAKEYTPDGYVNLKEVLNALYSYILPTNADFNPSKDPVGCLTRMIDGFKTMSNIPLKKEKPDNIEGISYVNIEQLQTKTPLLGLPEDDLARESIQVYLSMVAYWLGSRIEFTRTKEGVTETCSLDGSIPKVHDFDSWFKENYLDKLKK